MKQVILVILDGWGMSPIKHGNLLLQTDTPGLDTFLDLCSWTLLRPASLEVGLPWGSVGDSELGHYNLGTGQIVIRRGRKKPEITQIDLRQNALVGEGDGQELESPHKLKSQTSLGQILAELKIKQLKIGSQKKKKALTEAMNGYPDSLFPGEDYFEVKDWAKTNEVFTIHSPLAIAEYQFITVNLSECDELAHQGKVTELPAAIKRADQALQQILDWSAKKDGIVYLVSDHGNIEEMYDAYENINDEHTTNPVVFARLDLSKAKQPLAFRNHPRLKERISTSTPVALLADVAPTILADFSLTKPVEMAGINLQPFLNN